MSAAQKCECPAATGQSANQTTQQRESTPDQKCLATLIAQFAIAGHVVHKGCDSDFTVCKYANVRYCKDFAELQAFARQVGVK